MPNGGSDCCGTCWFNAKNKGERGYKHIHDPEPDACILRKLAIEDPFYTYCANHPQKYSVRTHIPIGPVFVGDSDGNREIWVKSPQTEEVRNFILSLLQQIQEEPPRQSGMGLSFDEIVIWQIGEFGDKRAVRDLERISRFIPHIGFLVRNQQNTIFLAKEALSKIQHKEENIE